MALSDIVFPDGDLQNFDVTIPAGTLSASVKIVSAYSAYDAYVLRLTLTAGASCWAY